jgi:pyridoxal phosphate enzyme (YggS family)
MNKETIGTRFSKVLENIGTAANRVNRSSKEIRLIVVTKAQPLEKVEAVIAAGAQDLGENYAEEAVKKITALRPEMKINWHMIGHVQSRKAPFVAQHFAYLHALDSLKLARRLERQLEQIGRKLPVLLEYNVGGETTKYGWPAWDTSQWPGLFPEIRAILEMPHLTVHGLMTVAPYHPNPELARPFYRQLRLLRDFLAENFPGADWNELSMGMSHDYEIAIEEGATFVRIGEAILGPRPKKA